MAEVIPIQRARAEPKRTRCRATTTTGRPCRNHAVDASGYCRAHGGADRAQHPSGNIAPTALEGVTSDEDEGSLQAFVRRRLAGDYEIDDFGLDSDLLRNVWEPLFEQLYGRWFRVRTLGLQRVPAEGPAMLVGNHSGTVALDSIVVQHAVATRHPARRIVRNLGGDLVFGLPFVGHMARRSGAAVARDEDIYELLARDELVGVYPEGYKGVGKGWRERYRLQRFGRGGFVEVALETRTPIVPVAIVGAEEAYPMIGNLKPLARVLSLPYFPITPTFPLLGPLGTVPLPSKWIIEFGEPMTMEKHPPDAADDAMTVFNLTDEVRDRIQQMLVKNLTMRGRAFL